MAEFINFSTVTIGLCVKNSEKTIVKTVESIKNLVYPPDKLNLVVVDGCSTDKTVKFINNEIKSTRFNTIFLSDHGRGLAYARQMVVNNCDSKYIVWVDGDNVLSKHFLVSHVQFIEKNLNFGFCISKIVALGDSLVSRLQRYQWIESSKKHDEEDVLGQIPIQGVICRVNAIKQVNGFDLSINGAGEDVDLFIKMRLNGWKMGVNNKAFIYHFMRDTWHDLWKESVWWGYGKYYLSEKYPRTMGPLINKRTALGLSVLLNDTIRVAKSFRDYACFFMPLYYLVRRMGYLTGYRQAKKNNYKTKFPTD